MPQQPAPKPFPGIRLPSRRTLSVSLMLAAAFYLLLALAAGWTEVASAIARLGAGGWLLVLGCSLCNYLLRFGRWQYYMRVLGHRIPLRLHLTYYMAGFALTTTPGKAGETIRSLYLKPHGVRYSESLASFFTERFLDVLVVAMLALFAVVAFEGYTRLVVLSVTVVLCALPVLRTRWLLERLRRTGRRQASRWRRGVGHLADLLETAHDLLELRPLYTGLAIGMLAWWIQGFAFYFILDSLGLPLPLATALAIYAISLLAGAASFIPGGVGSTEAVMALLLLASGADQTLALAAPLISRLSTLWFAVGLGMLATARLGLLARLGTAPGREHDTDTTRPEA